MVDSDGTRPDDPEETVREAVERSRSGAPAVGRVVRDRFSTDEVFQRIIAAADEEITSGNRELFFSGLAGGFAITITYLLYASMYGATDGHPILSTLLYPLGFLYIIIGGYQLYTENTLPPVALSLERLASLPALLRIWTIVLFGNFVGGAVGAAALLYGQVFSPEAMAAAGDIAVKGIETGRLSLFMKGAFAGLIVAGVVWVEYAAQDTTSRIFIIYLAFLAIPLGELFHVVVSFTEMIYLVLLPGTQVGFASGMVEFVLPVLLGNTLGGVLLVTVVNYFQTTEERLESARFSGKDRQLTVPEWLLGGFVGRSYVPLIDTPDETTVDKTDSYNVLVPISNPRTEGTLVELACTLASEKEGASVHAVHIVQVPERVDGGYGVNQSERIFDESEQLLEPLDRAAESFDVGFESSTVVSHRSFEEIFDIAERKESNLVLMGWSDEGLWNDGQSDRSVSELTRQLPCDFLVLKDRGLDTSRLLVPVAGGQNCSLCGDIARTLQSTADADVRLLHVVDDPDERPVGERFLEEWAAEHDLGDADLVVDDSGDVERAIAREAHDRTLAVIGATERGLLNRLIEGTLHYEVVDDVDCSVLLGERPVDRPLRERVFGLND